MRGIFEDQLVVDLVGEDDEIVAPGQFRNLLQHLARAKRSRGIVGIDQYDPARAWRDLPRDIS